MGASTENIAMTEPTAQPESRPPEPQPPASPSSAPTPSLLMRMSITQMTLVVIVVVFLWQWFDMHQQLGSMQQDLARRLADMEGNNKASQVLLAQERETLRELSGKVALLEARDAEMQSQRAALESLYQDLSSSRDDMMLVQVEQMVLIAGQQLQFAANVKAALIAMQQADDYLARMNRASQANVRKAIARDMDKLRALPDVDVPGISLHLDNLIASVDALPLAQDVSPAQKADTEEPLPPDASAWQRFTREIWNGLRQLVVIEDTLPPDLPLLSPTQTFFLRENLKLRLLSARTALLIRDETSYKHDLQQAQTWVTRYFVVQSGEGAQMASGLQKLREANISIALPDVSDSLEAVRSYRAAHEKSAR
jgi:uroporphyrin-3 C-methyltransferase